MVGTVVFFLPAEMVFQAHLAAAAVHRMVRAARLATALKALRVAMALQVSLAAVAVLLVLGRAMELGMAETESATVSVVLLSFILAAVSQVVRDQTLLLQ